MSRSNYWSCTKFADKIRGTKKPCALGMEEWADWKKDAKKRHPIRYHIADELLDDLQNFVNFIPDKIKDIKYYIRNRFISKSHCLVASKEHIKRGQWCDLTERLLICNFDALVDFVEIEKAHMQKMLVKDVKFKFKNGRSKEAGFAYLDWEIGLKFTEDEVGDRKELIGQPTPQAEIAKEIKELYLWWTKIYPNRVDPYDATKLDEYFKKYKWGKIPEDEKEEYNKQVDIITEMEKYYDEEDEEMLIRLMKIRRGLWT